MAKRIILTILLIILAALMVILFQWAKDRYAAEALRYHIALIITPIIQIIVAFLILHPLPDIWGMKVFKNGDVKSSQ